MSRIFRNTLCTFLLFSFSVILPLNQNLSNSDALKLLKSKIITDSYYEKRFKPDCLVFIIESSDEEAILIAIREKHDKLCGGDPNTNPIIDRFKILRDNGKILIYDYLSDEYTDF